MDAFTNKTSQQPAPGAAAGQKDDYVDKGEPFSLLKRPYVTTLNPSPRPFTPSPPLTSPWRFSRTMTN